MLSGQYRHQLDEKSRIRIPARLKEVLGDSPVIMKGTGKCLFVFSQDRANKVLEEKFGDNDFSNPEQSKAAREIFSSMIVAEEDKQGRIILPQNLLKHAQITKNIVTIGVFDRVEIWSEEVWENYSSMSAEEYDNCLKCLSTKN